MPLAYTNNEAIQLRLEGRLQVGGIPHQMGPQVTDPALIEQIGTQVESRVKAKLGQIYVLPLTGAVPIVQSIVEKFIISELLPVHQVDDPKDSLRLIVRREAEKELQEVCDGIVVLEGQALIPVSSNASSTTASNFSGVRQRKTGPAEAIEF